jgi:hypothetical protein
LFDRFGESDEGRFAGYLSLKQAVRNLRSVVCSRLRGGATTFAELQAIVDALDAAAKTIERLEHAAIRWNRGGGGRLDAGVRSLPAARAPANACPSRRPNVPR